MEKPKQRVLCVQDEKDTCEMLTHALVQTAYEVVSVSTFTEGLSQALANPFDVIILDSHFPDGSGITLCRQIRETDKQTPIIFYSADAFAHQIEEAMKAGASLYLAKPLSPDDVERAIGQLLSHPNSWPVFVT